MIRPDFREFQGSGLELVHSAKGTTWKNHKYVRKEGNRYIYPKKDDGKSGKKSTFDYANNMDVNAFIPDLKKKGYDDATINEIVKQYRTDRNKSAFGGAGKTYVDTSKIMADAEKKVMTKKSAGKHVTGKTSEHTRGIINSTMKTSTPKASAKKSVSSGRKNVKKRKVK